MFSQQCDVKRFMTAIYQSSRYSPGMPPKKIRKLRKRLIEEETKELCDAIKSDDMKEILDGIGDVLYVILGTANAYGLCAETIFNRVHKSNLTKLKDGHRRADGKWIKGPSFEPPDFDDILKDYYEQKQKNKKTRK